MLVSFGPKTSDSSNEGAFQPLSLVSFVIFCLSRNMLFMKGHFVGFEVLLGYLNMLISVSFCHCLPRVLAMNM